MKVSHSRSTTWRLGLALRAKVLGTLGAGYIERQFLVYDERASSPVSPAVAVYHHLRRIRRDPGEIQASLAKAERADLTDIVSSI